MQAAGRPALLPDSKTKTKEAWAPPRCHSDDVGAPLGVVSIRNTNNNNNKKTVEPLHVHHRVYRTRTLTSARPVRFATLYQRKEENTMTMKHFNNCICPSPRTPPNQLLAKNLRVGPGMNFNVFRFSDPEHSVPRG